MLKSERQEMILEILQECKYITTQELAGKTFSSYSSVRRDLEELEDAGLINRSYGKVELANRNSLLVSYPIRINKNSAQKNIIAKKAAALIKEGDTIFIDPSSSSSFFAKELFHMKGITVITNNVEVMSFMSQSSIDVICSGGLQTSPNRYALVGPIAETGLFFRHVLLRRTVRFTMCITMKLLLEKLCLKMPKKSCFSVTAQRLEQILHIISAALPTLIIWSVTARMQSIISKCILI